MRNIFVFTLVLALSASCSKDSKKGSPAPLPPSEACTAAACKQSDNPNTPAQKENTPVALTAETCAAQNAVPSFDAQICFPSEATFKDYCTHKFHIEPSQRSTVIDLLKSIETENCDEAEAKLKVTKNFSIYQPQSGWDMDLLALAMPELIEMNLDSPLKSYSFLEKFSLLQRLVISDAKSKSVDFQVLLKLPALQNLTLSSIPDISDEDITLISQIPNLQNLTLPEATYTSLKPLLGLTKLETLAINATLNGTSFQDELGDFSHLKTLIIFYGNGKLEFLSKMTSLESLTVGTLSEEFNPNTLASLQNLRIFNGNCEKKDCLSQLPEPQKLSEIILRRKGKTSQLDMSDLGNFNGLTKIYVSDTSEKNLQGLAGKTALADLSVYSGDLESLAGIENLIKLESIYFHRLPLTSLQGISSLKSLKSFQAETLVGLDVSELGQVSSLEDLSFSAGKFGEFSYLPQLTNLRSLSLGMGGNNFSDLKLLQGLTKLEYLYLGYGTVFEDLRPLAALPLLKEVIGSLGKAKGENCPINAVSPAIAAICAKR